ncbi:MAG: 50S ribosomal protein L3 N(5)-glutamine methyltransferase [Gammaproteobacteria bacterium]
MTAADLRVSLSHDALNTAQTARDLIRCGAVYFEASDLGYYHGTDNALDEAACLVLYALQIGHEQPDEVLDRELGAGERTRAIDLLEQRVASRKPAAYLTGEAWFAGLPFHVDERVLVPRSPLAELIEAQFTPWVDPAGVGQILDLCTGSGCIGIACAHYFPQAHVTLTDLSSDALAVARSNVERHDLGRRVDVLQSDVFSALDGRHYDIIVSNPPYVPHAEMQGLAAEFLHEPALGLVAGDDGLDIVVRILCDAVSHLTATGILVVEVGNTQDILTARFPDVPFMWLEFAFGGDGVFLLERKQLEQYRTVFDQAVAGRGSDRDKQTG